MPKPPFKLASTATGTSPGYAAACCEPVVPITEMAQLARHRLPDLDPNLHCSIIGTCLSAAELRKLMARFLRVDDRSDLEVHHEAVLHAKHGDALAKALHKLLDQRHNATLQRFGRAHGARALGELWNEAMREGEVPAAYWALLTHRDITSDLRQRAFGDVHMLSHLVGASNNADLRRLVALERDNAELRERDERHQMRLQQVMEERERSYRVA